MNVTFLMATSFIGRRDKYKLLLVERLATSAHMAEGLGWLVNVSETRVKNLSQPFIDCQ